MATELNQVMPVLSTILRLLELLHREGESRWSAILLARAQALTDARTPEERAEQVRQVLLLFGGMGSFNDFVLQNADGVKPGNPALDVLRSQLFAAATEAL